MEDDRGGRVGGAWAAGGETCMGRGVQGDRQLEWEVWTGPGPRRKRWAQPRVQPPHRSLKAAAGLPWAALHPCPGCLAGLETQEQGSGCLWTLRACPRSWGL